MLTREEKTAAVHYLGFNVGLDQVDRFRHGPVVLVVTHPRYREEAMLSDAVRVELARDLGG